VVAERPAATAQPTELREWGIVGAGLTPAAARERGRSSTAGVLVASLRAGGPAQQAKPPLEPDDVIVQVDDTPVRSTKDLEHFTTTALESNGRASVLVALERGRERRLSVVDLSYAHEEPPPLEARKAWLPVSLQALTPPLAGRLHLAGRSGVRVTRVIDPSLPLRVGDVVLAIDGSPMHVSAAGDEQAFGTTLREFAPGASVTLRVSRDGAEMNVPVTLATAPPQPREMPRYEDADFGFRARDLAEQDRDRPELDGLTAGAIVDAVEPGGWAALARLATGDVILSIGNQAVADVNGLAARLKAARAAKATSLVLRVRRGIRTLFIELQPAWNEER
jgi:S1-C subfamily serine protease